MRFIISVAFGYEFGYDGLELNCAGNYSNGLS